MELKGQAIGIPMLVTAVMGVAVLTGIASLVPDFTNAIVNATQSLSSLGVGGSIGALILSLLTGLAIGLGLAKIAGKIFGIEFGI